MTNKIAPGAAVDVGAGACGNLVAPMQLVARRGGHLRRIQRHLQRGLCAVALLPRLPQLVHQRLLTRGHSCLA